jgi:hypothetical protein
VDNITVYQQSTLNESYELSVGTAKSVTIEIKSLQLDYMKPTRFYTLANLTLPAHNPLGFRLVRNGAKLLVYNGGNAPVSLVVSSFKTPSMYRDEVSASSPPI